jgi:hypothetical protein
MRRRRPTALGLGLLLLTIATTGGCFVQRPPPNPYDRTDLPVAADSGIILSTHGYQAAGLAAAWREGEHVYRLNEDTRIGPAEGTPFGIRPTDPLLTVQEIPYDTYREAWHFVNLNNLWVMFFEIGILDSEITYSTFRYHQLFLYYSEEGQNRTHKGQLGHSLNSPIIRDHVVRKWEQGLEYLDRFLRSGGGRPVYLIREPDGARKAIPVTPDSRNELIVELRHPAPERRAAAAVLLGWMAGGGDTTALDALILGLDVGEPAPRTRFFLSWGASQFYGVGNLDLYIRDKLAAMRNREAAEELRRFLVQRIPGAVLLLGGLEERPG